MPPAGAGVTTSIVTTQKYLGTLDETDDTAIDASAGSATAARGLAAPDGGGPREPAGQAAGAMPPGRPGHG